MWQVKEHTFWEYCDLEMELFCCQAIVLTLLVATESDVGSILLKYPFEYLKVLRYVLSCKPASECSEAEQHKLMSLLADVEVWTGSDIPDKVGTVRIKKTETSQLEVLLSQSVLVRWTMALLHSDGVLPLKVINHANKPMTLKQTAKLADVYLCIELKDFDGSDMCDDPKFVFQQQVQKSGDVVSENGIESHLTVFKPPSWS